MMWTATNLLALDSIPLGSAEIVYAFVPLTVEPTDEEVALLDHSELHRAARFVRPADRARFVLAHAALRSFLARCLDVEFSTVRYEKGPHGKPRLSQDFGGVEFNLSHSVGLALLAVSRERPIGVDVEHIRVLPDAASIADATFSVAERNELRSLSADEQMAGFFRCWTRKEAVVKATGDGLGFALDSFDVSLSAASTSALTSYAGRTGPEIGISLRGLGAPAGYVAAAAALNPENAPLRWRELTRRS
jgi:4'-phosphopantetheinyl transferase